MISPHYRIFLCPAVYANQKNRAGQIQCAGKRVAANLDKSSLSHVHLSEVIMHRRIDRNIAWLRILSVVPCLFFGAADLAGQNRAPRLEPAECPFDRPDWIRDFKLECSWLIVPETRGKPNGRTIKLAVTVFRAATPTGTPLVALHGGPGASGIRIYLPAVRTDLARNRDLVICDQRGSGFSQPMLCETYGKTGDSARHLRTREERERLWDNQDRKCVASLYAQGIEPDAYNTGASGADLVDLRKALGYTRWDVYSGSYGARLAQEAMRLDPSGIRSVVLASPVTRGPTTQAEVALSAKRAFDKVWSACAAQSSCNRAFPTIGADFIAVSHELTQNPLPVTSMQGGNAADTIWLDGQRMIGMIRNNVLGRPGRLSRLPFLINEMKRGDRGRAARTLLGYVGEPAETNQQVLVHLVNCYDVYGPVFRRIRDSVDAIVDPIFRSDQMNDCGKWQTHFADTTEYAAVRSDIPVMIVTGHFDDRTPTEHAQRIAATLSHAYLYEFPNEGHGARPVGCHLSMLVQFFDNPFSPPDATCIRAIPPIQFVTGWDPP